MKARVPLSAPHETLPRTSLPLTACQQVSGGAELGAGRDLGILAILADVVSPAPTKKSRTNIPLDSKEQLSVTTHAPRTTIALNAHAAVSGGHGTGAAGDHEPSGILPDGVSPAQLNEAQAIKGVTSESCLPAPETPDDRTDLCPCVSLATVVRPASDALRLIAVKHRQRESAMRSRIALENATGALFRSALGWNFSLPADEQKRIREKAQHLIDAIDKACKKGINPVANPDIEEADRPFVADFSAYAMANYHAKAPYNALQAQLERDIKALVRSLPIIGWVDGISGLGEVSVGMLIAEMGDPSNYPHWRMLNKRFGVAPYENRLPSSWRKGYDGPRKLSADEWTGIGYCLRRRMILFKVMDSVLKKENAYTTHCNERRIYEIAKHPEFGTGKETKTGLPTICMWGLRRAHVYAAKKLLKDFWRAWRDSNKI